MFCEQGFKYINFLENNLFEFVFHPYLIENFQQPIQKK
jgi:hypothetical protein